MNDEYMGDGLVARERGVERREIGRRVLRRREGSRRAPSGLSDRKGAPAIRAVVAKPDPKWGETPCAFVELKAGAQTTPEDIVAHCKKHLAGFKVPRAVVFGELPKTSTGKIQKFELRKQAGSAAAINV